jgi:hypothetical protein
LCNLRDGDRMELQAFVEKHEQLGGDKKNDETNA